MQNEFANLFGLTILDKKGDINNFTCSSQEFENICFSIQSHHAYTWLLDIVASDCGHNEMKLKYIFINVEDYFWYSIEIKVSLNTKVKSIAHMWRNAMAFEQEINELFGLNFSRNYSNIYFTESSKHPMLKSFSHKDKIEILEDDNLKFDYQMIPKSKFRSNNEKISLNLKNNLIDKCFVHSGKYHIGIEKVLENKNVSEAYTLLEHYYPQNSIFLSFLISHAAELSLEIELTNRAKAIRMVLLELNRVLNHIQFLSNVAHVFKMEALYSNSLIWLKRIQSLFMSYTGNEFGSGIIRFGGVTKDVSQVWLSRTLNEIVWLENSILSSYNVLVKSQQIKNVFDFELLKKSSASAWSVSGPVVRAAGINLDFRKLSPFYFYEDVSFEIPIGVDGSGYDLLLVKFEEIFQSFNIMVQVLDNLPTGQIVKEEANLHSYFKDGTYDLREKEYKDSVLKYLKLNDFNGTTFVEGSNGLMNLSLDYQEQKINRIKYTSSSFSMKTLFEKIIKGNEISVARPLWTLFDINMKEVER